MSRTKLRVFDSDIESAGADRDTIVARANVEVREDYVTGAAKMDAVGVFAVTRRHDLEVLDVHRR